jgi:hypothetical protein
VNKRFITPDKVREMHALRQAKVTQQSIAEKLGCSRNVVNYHLNRGKILDWNEAARVACIVWRPVTATEPVRFVDVLLAVRGETEASEGFRAEGDAWVYSTGHDMTPGTVYAWAKLPACPPETREGAAP